MSDYDEDLEKRKQAQARKGLIRKEATDPPAPEEPPPVPEQKIEPHYALVQFARSIDGQLIIQKQFDIIEDQMLLYDYLFKYPNDKAPIAPLKGHIQCPSCKHVFAENK